MRYILILALVGYAACLGRVRADDVKTVFLDCHGARFTAVTRSVHLYDTAQEIRVRPPGVRRSRSVDLRQHRIALRHGLPGLSVLADTVLGWGCATTGKASFVILIYDCPQLLPDPVPARFCSDSSGWYRYVALDGSLLDKGFGLGLGTRNSDPRERGLRARLGLPPDDEDVSFEQVF